MQRVVLRGVVLQVVLAGAVAGVGGVARGQDLPRVRTSIDEGWRFIKGDAPEGTAGLLYDVRPAGRSGAAATEAAGPIAKAWISPTGNAFLKDAAKRTERPAGNLGNGVAFIAPGFNDSAWATVDLPHDYAIEGPFMTTGGGGMGRLPTAGVSWYRKSLMLPAGDAGKSVFLDIDGAMSYSEVWCNGQFVAWMAVWVYIVSIEPDAVCEGGGVE